ncbi:Calcium-binding EF hand family protein [Euphorbia peplus]|nr:Calcium-binding EF hand family protein [Euphorbia peplus]
MDLFEVYFKKADLDGDGRISGAEAVSFFKGSGLSQPVLAQVWMHADQNRTGALARPEFYNALRLVTVAQSKRDLTPDIVKAALYGPAAAKIPPPKINIPPSSPSNVMPAAPAPQMGAGAPAATQNLGFRGPGVPNVGMNQNYFPSQQTMRPPQAIPPVTASAPSQGIMSPEFSRAANMAGHSQPMPTITASHPRQPMPVSTASGPSQGMMTPDFSRAGNMVSHSQAMPTITASHPLQPVPVSTASRSMPSSNISADWLGGKTSATLTGPSPTSNVTAQLHTQVSPLSQANANDSKALVLSGNGFTSGASFGDDIFSLTPSTRRQETPLTSYSSSGPPASANVVPPLSGGLSKKSNSLDSLQSAFAMQPLGGLQRAQSLPTSDQQVSASSSSSLASPSTSVGVGISSDNSQPQWPKMKPSDVQKYTKVFMEVDTDRDGRISGDQARNLFLSWRLPREVLKQVWDLSDQDNDSMLSLREFCIALYLMERFREGRPLPASLPSNLMFDDMLLSMTGQPNTGYGNQAWGPSPSPGFVQHPGMGPRPMGPGPPGSNLRPPVPGAAPQVQPDGVTASIPQQPRGPVLEESFLNDTDRGDRNSTPQDGKVDESTKLILDSKEKIEFYRSKMQELVLYKSRCDNRLNEITERAIADKREADMLGKKYEEKYKQVAEAASKLTIEEAQLRDVQARKSELHQAIVNMEQGGSADGILQVRADRIQSDLDELLKALTERCKKHGIEVKSSAMIELPVGWQPGIQENAVVWDEEWDKFEDDGFGNDLTVDVKNLSSTMQKENELQDANLTPDSLSNGDEKSRNFSTGEPGFDGESTYAHSEDEPARSPQSTAMESPSQEFSDVFAKSTDVDAETNRSFDESTWGGAFDTHDDTDSVWGFNPASTKDSDFGTGDFGVKPVRTGSPSTENIFNKKSPFFEDSVAGSPVSRFANSPRYSEAGDQFDNFSRFDSFSVNEGGFSPKERFSRFDSMNSTKDFGQSHNFSSSFDEADPFGSHDPFKVSSDHQTPKRSSDNWNAF